MNKRCLVNLNGGVRCGDILFCVLEECGVIHVNGRRRMSFFNLKYKFLYIYWKGWIAFYAFLFQFIHDRESKSKKS